MRNTNKAFTLVELIVVITILAILGTIAFISLQGYTGEAKNSKVTSDLRNIASAIETASTRNSVLLADVLTTNATVTANNLVDGNLTYGPENIAISSTGTVVYGVGNVNFSALEQNGEDFRDPNSTNPDDANEQADYLFGVLTSPEFKAYQLAGQIIENDVKKARINGTFYTASGTTANGLISSRDNTDALVNDDSISSNLY